MGKYLILVLLIYGIRHDLDDWENLSHVISTCIRPCTLGIPWSPMPDFPDPEYVI